jgi:Subtilase family
MKTAREPTVEVIVHSFERKPLERAGVEMKPLSDQGKELQLQLDRARGAYRASGVAPGEYLLRVRAEGYEPDERQVVVDPGGLSEWFVLGKKDMPFYYRGRVRVPFEPPDLIGVSVRRSLSQADEDDLLRRASELKLRPEEVGEAIRSESVRVFRLPGRASKTSLQEILRSMEEQPAVSRAGLVVEIGAESVSFLTNQLVAKFGAEVPSERVEALAAESGLQIKRTIPYAGNAFLLRFGGPATYEILDACAQLAASDQVEWAEPNLVITTVDAGVPPTDFLYPQQWSLPLIGLETAWKTTYGSPDVIIAIMDNGIQSQTDVAGTTSPKHPDFNGTVSSGANKVYKFFDFRAMVPNNDATYADFFSLWHGMKCAGVAGALANNPVPNVPGENEGIVGAAPNCRLMGVIRPTPYSEWTDSPENHDTELQYADAWVWTAGLNPFGPGSVDPNFPPPINPGADIISNSFSSTRAAPSSGTVRAAFDFLTTYGRGGKGVIVVFAAGNDSADISLVNSHAADDKTIAVAASTNAEVKASYSNWGSALDICAPSSDDQQVHMILSTQGVGTGVLAGHTGGSPDYGWGGRTSIAAPLAAGVAALVLSVNPGLTWMEVRDVLRATAVKIDPANADPTGHWLDANGDASLVSGLPPVFSQWYGYGRLNAAAAVAAAPSPTIISFSPLWGPVGTPVVIEGTNLTWASDVKFFGDVSDPTFQVSATQITATVPPGATTGPISVTTPSGTAISSTDFTVTPAITSFDPPKGPVGTSVTIKGTNLNEVTSVTFFDNVSDPSFQVGTPTEITAIVPLGATTGIISVTTPSGTGTSSTVFIVTPAITSFTPTSGPVGTLVTIQGPNLGEVTSVTFFDNVPAPVFQVDSPTQITVTVPPGATTGLFSVTTPSGTVISLAEFTVGIVPIP